MMDFLKYLSVNLLPEKLFELNLTSNEAKKLFSTHVEIVEIENHNYCNRTCLFCPNSQFDRHSSVVLLPEAVFQKIIDNLAEIQYKQTLVWSRYHEPLAHESILKRLSVARQKLSQTTLVVISNGDYLTQKMIKQLEDVGLDRLIVDLYLEEGRERDSVVIDKALEQFTKRTGLEIEKQKRKRFDYDVKGSSIRITLGMPLYMGQTLSTRAGLIKHPDLKNYQRTAICVSPIHTVEVDYTGNGMLCCQVRSDAPQHQQAIIGDLNDPLYSLFDLYRDLAAARIALTSGGPKSGICKQCNVSAKTARYVKRTPLLSFLLKKTPGLCTGFKCFYEKRMASKRWT
jgi:MoaA/NifB/PqqE/SkfB family radical SAM enzyme